MAHPKRFELLTPRFVVWCSIQLSYGCIFENHRNDVSSQSPRRHPVSNIFNRLTSGFLIGSRKKCKRRFYFFVHSCCSFAHINEKFQPFAGWKQKFVIGVSYWQNDRVKLWTPECFGKAKIIYCHKSNKSLFWRGLCYLRQISRISESWWSNRKKRNWQKNIMKTRLRLEKRKNRHDLADHHFRSIRYHFNIIFNQSVIKRKVKCSKALHWLLR